VVKYSLQYKSFFPLEGVLGVQGLLIKICDPPIISETTRARKLKLKTLLEVVKYSHQMQIIFPLGAFRECRALN